MKFASGVVVLALVYLSLADTARLADVGTALLVGVVANKLSVSPSAARGGLGGFSLLLGVVRFAAAVVRELMGGAWSMRGALLPFNARQRRAFVEMPGAQMTDSGRAWMSLILSASPGSVFVCTDETRAVLVIDEVCLSTSSVDRHKRLYADYQRAVVP